MRVSRRKFLVLLAAGSLLASLTAGVTSVGVETSTVNMGVGRKVVFIADLHLHGARRLELPEYDLLLVGGDTYDEFTPSLDAVVETLGGLRGPKVAVLGNHEHWSSKKFSLREGIKALEGAGVHVLVDDWTHAAGLKIYGLDWREDPRDYPAAPDADIVLVHSPDAFHAARAGIYLAGHTHGGQLCLPRNVPLRTNSHFGYTWGLYRRGSAVMYVTRGLGEIAPRVFCDREVVVVL